MMTLIPMESRGLVILPTHRIVHGLLDFDRERMLEVAGQFFDIDRIDLRTPKAAAPRPCLERLKRYSLRCSNTPRTISNARKAGRHSKCSA